MTTRFIGIKEFRQNMAKISKDAERKGQRLIVLRKNKPVFELRPLSGSDALIEIFRHDIEEARADVRAGRVFSENEVIKALGL